LLSTLELAQDAVRTQHPRLDYFPLEPHPTLPVSEVLAEILVQHCADLADLVARYNAVVDLATTADDEPF